MKVEITEYRDGRPPVYPGQVVELPDDEARKMIAGGGARKVNDEAPMTNDERSTKHE